jgi:hypothetical protein
MLAINSEPFTHTRAFISWGVTLFTASHFRKEIAGQELINGLG